MQFFGDLQAGRLADLGAFAAHLDFHLVLWLGRERDRSAVVSDFPSALARLHCDFAWPYPILSAALVEGLQRRMASLASSPTTGRRPGSLQVVTSRELSQDSGVQTLELTSRHNGANPEAKTKALLMRQNLSLPKTPEPDGVSSGENGQPDNSQQLLQAQLRAPISSNHARAQRMSSITGSELTEDSWGLVASSPGDGPDSPSELDWEGLEALCGEAAARGPPTSEAQLRFLQQLLLEAACLDWSLLLCILLRDFVGLGRALSSGALALNGGTDSAAVRRCRKGLGRLEDWALGNCPGYKPILTAVGGHLDAVLAALPPSTASVSSPALLSTASSPPSSPTETLRTKKEMMKEAGKPVRPPQLDFNPPERIHVDIVSPMSPGDEENGGCELM